MRLAVLVAAAVASCWAAAAAAAQDRELGKGLYLRDCVSCHGRDGRGVTSEDGVLGPGGVEGEGPTLTAAGASAVDLYLRAGYMPLRHADDPPERRTPRYDARELDALVGYATSLGTGPSIPHVKPERGDLREGLALFTENCAGCHQIVGEGGVVTGAVAPGLKRATPTQIAEAVRVGPYLMPRFSPRQLSDRQLDSIVRYVELTRDPVDRGGWAIGHLGPVPEGLVAWLLAGGVLVGVARLIAKPRGVVIGRWLVAAVLLLLGRGRRPPVAEVGRERVVAPGPVSPRAELVVLALLAAATAAAVGFVVVFALDPLGHRTQLLGIALGLAFALLGAAALVAGTRLAPDEEVSEPYPLPSRPAAQEVAQIVEESGERLTRRRLLKLAAGGAGATLGAALVVPAASLGPFLEVGRLRATPWRRGARLVDSQGRPLLAEEIGLDAFFTAFPEGAPRNTVGSPLVVVRLDPGRLELPAGRELWAPRGIVAYSKICTHAGCAVSLYRAPLFEPTSARPALVCPCHYSTFDPAAGAAVLFGPAGRPLPQLPLEIDGRGELRAAGPFSGPVGPSWWGVRSS